MHGHGVKGHFGGIKGEKSAEIVLIPVPFELTSTYQKGSKKGPDALIEASRNLELYDIETDSEIYLKGIFTDVPVLASSSEELQKKLYERVKSWIELRKYVVVVGGEHAISTASIRAFAEKKGPLTVLQLDAHADLYPKYEEDPWSHASVMARVMEIPQVKKIVSVGIRSLAKEEQELLKKTDCFFAHHLQGDWMNEVLKKLEGPIYLTFDFDVFDSSLMPSTGTPEPGGLQWNEALTFLRKVSDKCFIVGFDLVELCPNPHNKAPDFLAAKLLYKLLSYVKR